MANENIVKKVVDYIVTQIVEDTSSVSVDIKQESEDSVVIEVRTAEQLSLIHI